MPHPLLVLRVLFGLTTVFLALIMEVLPVLFGLAIGLITFVFPSALISAQKAWKYVCHGMGCGGALAGVHGGGWGGGGSPRF